MPLFDVEGMLGDDPLQPRMHLIVALFSPIGIACIAYGRSSLMEDGRLTDKRTVQPRPERSRRRYVVLQENSGLLGPRKCLL